MLPEQVGVRGESLVGGRDEPDDVFHGPVRRRGGRGRRRRRAGGGRRRLRRRRRRARRG